jgi:hypothetical protein
LGPAAAVTATAGSSDTASVGAEAGKLAKPSTAHVDISTDEDGAGRARRAVQAASFTTPTANFDGIDGDDGDLYYPDAQLDVGPEHVVETISSWLAVYSKSGTLLGETSIPDFFAASSTGTPCSPTTTEEKDRLGDSSVFYDTLSDRWFVISQAYDDFDTGPYYTCIAASTTGNPLDTTWNFYAPKVFAKGDIYPNNFKYGLWNDGLYMAADVDCADVTSTTTCPFSAFVSGGDVYSFVGAQVWGFNRADMLDGAAMRWQTTIGTGRVAQSSQTFDSYYFQELHPASFRKQTGVPPDPASDATGGAYFLENDNPWGERTGITMWRWRVNWNTPASSTISAPARTGNGAVPGVRDDFPSPQGNALYSNYDYLTGRVQYVNQGGSAPLGGPALVAVHAYDNGSGATLRARSHWFRFGINAATGGLITTGTGSGNNQWQTNPGNQGNNYTATNDMDRFNPSVAVDKNGNMALVHQTVNGRVAQPPTSLSALRYTGRLQADTQGTITQPETSIVQSTGYAIGDLPDDGGPNTWFGPSTQTVLDPDGCTFWTVGQYFDVVPTTPDDVHWKTRIASFGYPSSECTRDLLATSVSTSGLAPSVGADTGVLKATLTATGTGSGIGGKTVAFELGGNPVGNAVTNNKGVATLSGVDVTAYSVGTSAGVVAASFGGLTDTYDTSTNTGDLKVKGGTAQAITFDALGDKTFGDADFNVSATSDSALAVSFSASGKCSVTGTLVHIKGAGSCTITASQDGDDTFAAAADVPRTFAIAKANQSVVLGAQAGNNVGQVKNLTVTSASPASRTVEWSVDNGNCRANLSNILNGVRITSLHAGTCNVTASLPGDANYNAASQTQSFTIGKGTQTLSVSPTQATRRIDQISHQVTHSWSSGLTSDTFVAENAGPFTVLGTNSAKAITTSTVSGTTMTVTSTAHGFTAGQAVKISGSNIPAHNGVWIIATSANANTFTITVPSGTATGGTTGTATVAGGISAGATSGINTTAAHNLQVGTHVTIAGSSETDYNVSGVITGIGATGFLFTNANSDVATGTGGTVTQDLTICSNAGNEVTVLHTGACKITATQGGNDDWNSASTTVTKGILKGNQGASTIAPAGGGGNPRPIADGSFDVTVSLNAATAAATPELRASGLSPGTVSINVADAAVCSVGSTTNNLDGTATATVTPLSGGTCRVDVSGNAGNDDWATRTAQAAIVTYTITKTSQSIDFDSLPDKNIADDPFEVSATATSGLDVSFSSLTGSICTVAGTTVTLTGTEGLCTIRASQAGNDYWAAAPNVDRSFEVIDRDPQSIDFPDQTDRTLGDADFDPGATASSNLEVSYSSLTASVCTIVDNKVHLVKNGTCTVQADQGGDFYFTPATPVSKSFTVYTTPKIGLKYVKPKKNVTWGGNVRATFKATAKGRKPSGLVTVYIAPKGSEDWDEVGTLNYISGKKKMALSVAAPCGPSNGKYQLTVSFTDNAGSQQTVWFKKPMGKPFQLKKTGPGLC